MWKEFEPLLKRRISEVATAEDPAHDLLHFQRVVEWAKRLGATEGANMDVVVPAAWLHDLVVVPKNDARRKIASRLSADAAVQFLAEIGYPNVFYDRIAHAIEAHSFSASITPLTIEAKVVQDADRLDGLGAIGIARCFAVAGLLKRPFYSDLDPFCEKRLPNDQKFTIDHFYAKLFLVAESLQTEAGRAEGQKRLQVMKEFLDRLEQEIGESLSQ